MGMEDVNNWRITFCYGAGGYKQWKSSVMGLEGVNNGGVPLWRWRM